MHFARSLMLAILVALPAAAGDGDCRMGTNMPAGDAGQARMVCNEGTLTTRARDGSVQQIRMWTFELKK